MNEVGDRIRLVYTNDKHTNLKPGDEGTVSFIDDLGTVSANWDNGSNLGLIPGVDRWETLPRMITLEVKAMTTQADDSFTVSAETIPEAFKLIPLEGANRGLALVNDGETVVYSVRVR